MNIQKRCNFRLTALAGSLLLAFGPASAQEAEVDEVAVLSRPESSVSLGIGYVDGPGSRFGQYTGQKDGDTNLLGHADINRRNDATGTWLRFKAKNLGLDNRDLRLEHEKQGDWAYFIEYGQLKRTDPLTFTTPLAGIGSTSQTINPAGSPSAEYQPQVKRETTRLGFEKKLEGGFNVQLRFRNEDKDGSRNFGFYDLATFSPKFLSEPIHQKTQEVEATLGYVGEKLQLTGGYFGSYFKNQNNAIAMNGDLGPVSPYWPLSNAHTLSLPPGNDKHNLNLSGGYNFTPTTRGVFKVAYTRGLQNNSFASLSDYGQGSLDGRVDTTMVTLGLSARPTSKLALNGHFRYEDRDDKTAQSQYSDPNFRFYTGNGRYNSSSRKTVTAKVDGTYRLPLSLSLFGGLEWEQRTRDVAPSRSLNWRSTTDEWSLRLGLKRSLADNMNGTVSYARSERTGSGYQATSSYVFGDFYSGNGLFFGPVNQSTSLINPIHWADRTRDKLKLNVDWSPLEALSVQMGAQFSQDSYGSANGSPIGNDRGRSSLYSLDATYSLSEDSKLGAWVSRDDTRMRQRTNMGYDNSTPLYTWSSDLRSLGTNLGLRGEIKATEKLKLDAELQWSNNRNQFDLQNANGATLPDVTYRHTSFKLTGDYALDRSRGLKLQYVYDRWNSSDWNWAGESAFQDGTTATTAPVQRLNFIGLSAYFKWI